MAKRRSVPKKTETEVLRRSRRRCCICLGLKGDDAEKRGHIAHLDGDPSNNDIDNLAWLCLNHHDQYDSKTSQSKNLTVTEVKAYRDELYKDYRAGVRPTAKTDATWGKLLLADEPPVFKPNPKTFATNRELIRGGRVVNTGDNAISLGSDVEVRTVDADGTDLNCAKDIRAEYRVRKRHERLSRESIAPSSVAPLLRGYEAFIEIVVSLDPGRRFDSIRLMIPCDPPVERIGPRFPINVKVKWPSVYEERGLIAL